MADNNKGISSADLEAHDFQHDDHNEYLPVDTAGVRACRKKRSKLPLVLTWSISLAAVGLVALALLHTQMKVSESQTRLLAQSQSPVTQAENARTGIGDANTSGDVAMPEDDRLELAAPRVTVLPVASGSYQTTIQAFGEVKARTTLTLSSESTGRVEWVAPEFTVGGRVKAGATLLRVSPRNYLTAKANAEQEQANARQEAVMAEQELSNAYQEVAAAEQEALNAKQGIPNAYQANASADHGIASATQGIASASQGVASAQQAIANAEKELSASYHEIASAEQAMKQEQDQARTVNQPWSGRDAVANAQQEVQNALLAVKQEKAQALLAQEDWKRAGMKGRPSELASRQPQLAAANARFQAVKIALQKAQYELKQQGGELAQRKPQIKAAKARMNAARTRLDAAKAGLITARKQAVTAQKQVVTAQKQTVAAKAQANASRGNIDIAQAHIKTAKARMNSAQAKVRSAKARIATAKVRLKTAEATLEKAEYDLNSTVIRAPFDAIIGSKTVAVGSYVNAGTNIGELRASDAAEVTLALSMQQASQLAADKGIVVELHSDEYPGAVWQGEVKRIADYIEPTTRTRNVTVRIEKPLEQTTPLLTGSFVSATLQGKERAGLLKIPNSALAADGFLWFVDDNNTLQRIARTVVFSQDGALFVAAPEAVEKLEIVRWPLAGYLPGMAVTPASEQAAGDSGEKANPTAKNSAPVDNKAGRTAQLDQVAVTGAAL